jgi:hypothetical protein
MKIVKGVKTITATPNGLLWIEMQWLVIICIHL